MRRAPSAALPAPPPARAPRLADAQEPAALHLGLQGPGALALACLVAAKGANVSVPIVFKHLIDGLTITPEQAFIVVPAALLLASMARCASPPRC